MASGIRLAPQSGQITTPERLIRTSRSSAPETWSRTLERLCGRFGAWVPASLLAVIMASDYKLRTRSVDDAISGAPDPVILLEIGIYAVVAVFLLLRFGRWPRPRRVSAVIACTYALVAVLVVSAFYSPYLALAGVRAVQMVIILALMRAVARFGDRASLHRFAHAFVVMLAVSVIFGALVRYPQPTVQAGRFNWLYVHPVVAGLFLGLGVTLLFAYLLHVRVRRPGGLPPGFRHWPLPVYGLLLAILVGGLIATKTRGALLGAAVGCVVVLWMAVRGRRRLEVAAVLLVGGVGIAAAAGDTIVAFLQRGESTAQLASLNSRTELWSIAWSFIEQRPLFGWGLGATRGLFLDSIGLGGGHNALINVLTDGGLVATVTWLAVLVTLAVGLLRLPGLDPAVRLERALLLGVLAFLVTDGMFTEGLGAPANVASTWLFVAVAWYELLRTDRASQPRAGTS